MKIVGKRIRNLKRHIGNIPINTNIIIGKQGIVDLQKRLINIGFSPELRVGETVLPDYKNGPIANYNVHGKIIKHKDQPMETCYRHIEWTWKQWAGRYDTEEHSKIVEKPYKRYPRTLIPPPSLELSISVDSFGNKVITSSSIILNEDNEQSILHRINLFLELFGECDILTEEFTHVVLPKIIRINWDILPQGRFPWEKTKRKLMPLIEKAPKGNHAPIMARLNTINKYNPDFTAIGRAGFRGYVIFGFQSLNLFVLESMYEDNATYIFKENWEYLSKSTKAEILNYDLQDDRIIHRKYWPNRIAQLFIEKS